ncbi:DUF58 domain-containing protein [Rheinheimera riviphila]|uniref:DUF58 domain-containing protein n=1 Tax=Rheinheimera riviphila TaxID=1834037 RepID=A0A437QSY4_9GAMM|nr:DUF58 domain-containing protein [Rheinheimera riviphila]RVU37638.1 DUF58 domain-containing protein [Rheinheimera riviphila]
MEQQAQIRQWLAQLHCDGSNVELKQLLRYQRHTQLFDLTPAQTIQSKLAGSYLAKSKGRGMEFDEVRHYQTGDDVRTIDWRVTARTGKVHTKLFREEKERPVFILTDLNHSMQFGSTLLLKSVQAAHLAALIAWHVKKSGDKLGGLLFHQQQIRELKPAGRSVAVLRYLHQLIELQQQSLHWVQQQMQQPTARLPESKSIDLATALGQLRRLARPGSLLFIISDFQQLDATCLRHLQALRLHNEIRICQISDPLEQQLPAHASGIAKVSDGAHEVTLDLAGGNLKHDYQAQQQAFHQQLHQHWTQLGCRHWQFSASEPLLDQFSGRPHGEFERR